MRRIKDGTAYDTETGELIVERSDHHDGANIGRLYRTRNGAYFLWAQYVTPGYEVVQGITPFDDEAAQALVPQQLADYDRRKAKFMSQRVRERSR